MGNEANTRKIIVRSEREGWRNIGAGRTVRANLIFDAGLLEVIDEEAQNRGLTRSAFLVSAARERLGLC